MLEIFRILKLIKLKKGTAPVKLRQKLATVKAKLKNE